MRGAPRARVAVAASVIGTAFVCCAFPAWAGSRAQAARPHLYHVAIGVDFFYRGFVVNSFLPSQLTIHAGDSVQWTNLQGVRPQTVTFGSLLNTPPLFPNKNAAEANPDVVKPQGGHVIGDTTQNIYASGALASDLPGLSTTYTFTFPTPGKYFYRSLFHPDTLGEIDVVPRTQSASPDPPDTGSSFKEALRSINKAIDKSLPNVVHAGVSGGQVGTVTVQIGGGDGNISLTTFSPNGLVIKVGSTITWTINEESGEPHVLVFFPTVKDASGVPLYTGRAPDGGLTVNPAYRTALVLSGTTLTTNTVTLGRRFTSGLLYGSSPNAPSAVPSQYTLTFDIPGNYLYQDPFLPGNNIGAVQVIP